MTLWSITGESDLYLSKNKDGVADCSPLTTDQSPWSPKRFGHDQNQKLKLQMLPRRSVSLLRSESLSQFSLILVSSLVQHAKNFSSATSPSSSELRPTPNHDTTTATTPKRKRRIVVALSGGVDSSVVAATLRKSVVGCVHMTNWNVQDTAIGGSSSACTGTSDLADAQAVARTLRLPLHHVKFQSEYYHDVFEPFVDEIQNGRMPNPDIGCNQRIKFGALKAHVRAKFGPDAWLATGHYARLWDADLDPSSPPECLVLTLRQHPILRKWLESRSISESSDARRRSRSILLLQAADASKDQTYFLAGCHSDAFDQVLFPLGDLLKKASETCARPSVRQMALDYGLPTAHKPDSTGICAVGGKSRGGGGGGGGRNISFRTLVGDYLPPATRPLVFVDVDTRRPVGQASHLDHACLYTIGQGAKLSGLPSRYFVSDVDVTKNVVYVCAGTHHPALYSSSLEFEMQWVCERMEEMMFPYTGKANDSTLNESRDDLPRLRVTCRIRHLQPLMDAWLHCQSTPQGRKWALQLDHPTRAVTLGQMAVLYLGVVCLGGGPITRRGISCHECNEPLPREVYRMGHNDTSELRSTSFGPAPVLSGKVTEGSPSLSPSPELPRISGSRVAEGFAV
jgi:tRNA-specific 2-thiouridylase